MKIDFNQEKVLFCIYFKFSRLKVAKLLSLGLIKSGLCKKYILCQMLLFDKGDMKRMPNAFFRKKYLLKGMCEIVRLLNF